MRERLVPVRQTADHSEPPCLQQDLQVANYILLAAPLAAAFGCVWSFGGMAVSDLWRGLECWLIVGQLAAAGNLAGVPSVP